MFSRKFVVVGVIFVALFLAVGVANAQADVTSPVEDALAEFAGVLGLAAAVSTFVQVLKAFGVIPDGTGGQVTLVLNLLIFVAAYAAGILGYDVSGEPVRQGIIAVGELVTVFLTSILFFKGMRMANVRGFRPRPETETDSDSDSVRGWSGPAG